ncbi:Protein furry homolog [Geodia barretti]|uniref:Protein furry homolog n=2 Tax=Geodia barretti TaxID=519541 RepID=A0AA35X5J6_GEOBA|nr:Protein furry homolog [Geodia barretti]
MTSADQSTSPVPEADGGSAGEFVLKKLFAGFVAVSERKLQHACNQPLDYSLAKGLVRGEDAQFDQILSALNEVSSFCLRSMLTAIFKWRDMQIEQCRSNPDLTSLSNSETTDTGLPASKKDRAHFIERRELAVEFVFCLVLVEVMPRLSVHPVPESFIHSIEDLAFTHFKLQESLKDHRALSSPNVTNMRKIADLYAEVIGVLSQSRFHSVRRRFFLEIRNPDYSPATVISIIEGMSFVRVKMFPVEELEQWFVFLQECARFFLDCPREKIKAAMSALLVEILLPVAAVINLEASLPVAKKLVSLLYGHCMEHARRARYSNTYIPLATVLLAISEQTFFLNNWHLFLVQNLLPSLKRGDTKIHNIALVSLYRLVWVYMVRIKGESNKTTMLRLRTVLDTLFPRGQRGVNPKEMPLNIFVKLIQFIARERLEYAMQEVILELLSQGKTKTAIYPERMIIGLRAFLMITDSLEKKEGDPPMPINPGPLPSRGVSRVKNRFLSNTLSDETARKIGISQFYPAVRRALDGILRSLDHHVGRQLTSTNPQTGKSVEEILSTVKPKLDLLKTCVAAIPRILPDNTNQEYLTDLLSRLTIHLDHELGRAAANSLHTMVTNYPTWRHSIVQVFVQFLLRDVPDSCPLVLEATLKLLIQFVRDWRQLVTSPDRQTGAEESSEEQKKGEEGYCIPWVEACGLVTLCSYRSVTRRFSLVLLKEVRSLHEALAGQPNRVEETPVMDIIELATPAIVKRYLSTLSVAQRTELRVTNQALTLTWLADRAACFLEQGGSRAAMRDPWALCLAGLMEPSLLPKACQSATRLAWPYLYHRMAKAYMVLDPAGLVADKGDKPSSMRGKGRPIVSTVETFLWRNYFIFASCSAPPSSSQESSQDGAGRPFPTARDLFQRVVPLIRWDGEIREVAVTALGLVNPPAFGDLVEQLQPVIHDALEQRKDVKRRRRREALKIQITRVFSLAAEHGCFQHSHVARTEHGQLSPVLLDFIEGIKSHFDSEKEGVHSYPELRLHFAGLIANIINGVPQGESRMLLLSPVTRQGLFYLFATWCGLWQRVDVDTLARNPQISFNSLQAMSALLCCGPVFQADGLEKNSLLYRWLDNMLNCKEGRVQALGQRTVQLLLANNANCPTLLRWVVDRCYDNQPGAAQLCFHALATTMETFPDYPFDMVTVLHVVLFKTADPEPSVRERAMQLLQLLDSRFLSESGHSRPELLGCLTGGTYSQSHIVFSKELATTNPELTFPIFSEMVYRFEMAPHSGQRSILQYMVPWLANMELVEENQSSPYIAHSTAAHASWPRPSSAVLQGTGWGSLDGTKLVLHNLLYITAKFGEEHTAEVEGLWSALCSWQNNLRITINYLARLTCACGNMAVMVQHAKRIMVSFSHSHASAIITELIRDLQSVEIISAELQPSDSPPFYCMSGGQGEGRREREGKREAKGSEGEEWSVRWRSAVRGREGSPVALPVPPSFKQHFASLKTLLKLPVRQLVPLHRCNFALMILSELVLELQSEVEWTEHLPLLLHVGLLGLDLLRPLVYEHSKALLGNLVIVVACKDNMLAALQARLVQQEMSPAPLLALLSRPWNMLTASPLRGVFLAKPAPALSKMLRNSSNIYLNGSVVDHAGRLLTSATAVERWQTCLFWLTR